MHNKKTNFIKIFVFGTLREGERLEFYMDGSDSQGLYYTQGELMKSELGSAYIEFVGTGNAVTIGELHLINFPALLRIDHLESTSGEFPKGYDLDLIPIWKYDENKAKTFDEKDKTYAFFYKRRNDPVKVNKGDWTKRTKPVEEIQQYIDHYHTENILPADIISYMQDYLK